ncbi:MAG: DUF393 domain-containing protein [Chitinophagaceae bacterium]|nr:MAG: DUF393 domain-containing protein [Chitinophagaceae bacterium]
MKTIIYDDGCPLCQAYTAGFVQAGILTKEGRKNFNNADAGIMALVDPDRCHNEIPLVDSNTNQVWYGVDSLLELLGSRAPFIKKFGNLPLVNWLLRKLYNFISYNRKVIVGTLSAGGYDCSPRFSIKYRLAFIISLFLLNSALLISFYHSILHKSILNGTSLNEVLAVHFMLALIHLVIAVWLGAKKGIEYFGQVTVWATTASLLLLPLHFASVVRPDLPSAFHFFYLGIAAMLLCAEYGRRIKYVLAAVKRKGLILVNLASLLAVIVYFLY